MKYVKYIGIAVGIGVILGVTGIVKADLAKVNDQAELTLDNAETELENIMAVKARKLIHEENIELPGQQVYTNKDGDLYYISDTSEVIGYSSDIEPMKKEQLRADESNVIKTAEEYLTQLVDDVSYYQLDNISYDEYTYRYSLVYIHKIGEVGTTDIVYLTIDNELRLDMFMLPRPYAFQEMEDIEINIEAIRQQAIEIFDKKYGESRVGAEGKDLRFATDEEGNIGFQVEVKSNVMVEGETMEDWDMIFVPFNTGE